MLVSVLPHGVTRPTRLDMLHTSQGENPLNPLNIDIDEDRESIAVWLREDDSGKLYTFHCVNCGYILFQHTAGVDLIVPEDLISIKDFVHKYHGNKITGVSKVPPVILRCKNKTCKTQYNIR